jgi:hypothetical protein
MSATTDLRERIATSPLARAGGATCITVGNPKRLAAEARRCRADASEAIVHAPPVDDWDRGNPDRWMETATGGDELYDTMHSPQLRRQLHELTGVEWEPLAQLGTYSYYCAPAHHLGVHRDIVTCDLSVVIVCEISGDGSGGDLVTYPKRVRDPLSAIRSSPDVGAVPIDARPGQAAVIFGGIVPHRVERVDGDRYRVVAPLCFRVRR